MSDKKTKMLVVDAVRRELKEAYSELMDVHRRAGSAMGSWGYQRDVYNDSNEAVRAVIQYDEAEHKKIEEAYARHIGNAKDRVDELEKALTEAIAIL